MGRGGPQTHAQKAKKALTVKTSRPGKWQPVPRPSSPQDAKAQEIKLRFKNSAKHGPPFLLLSHHPLLPSRFSLPPASQRLALKIASRAAFRRL